MTFKVAGDTSVKVPKTEVGEIQLVLGGFNSYSLGRLNHSRTVRERESWVAKSNQFGIGEKV